jgi:hypothetical protein
MSFPKVNGATSQSMRCLVLKSCFVLVLGLALSLSLMAQSATEGAIGGTVYDPAGAVVPNASVVVHNNGTNVDTKGTTDASGYYRVNQLPPAVYTVSVTSQGFSAYKAEKVIVSVGNLTDVSPRLGVAGSAETVNVTSETPQINTTSPDFAPTVDQVQIDQLPINGGRWSDFSLLTPGVVNNSSGFGLLSVRGISTLLNNNTVDGADNNQAFFSEERGRTRAGYSTPRVAVQEFQVNTSNYSAEYGRAAGAVINTVTKSGTNQFHGEGYFLDRDNDWGAVNPFNKITTQTSPGVFTTTIANPKNWRKIWGGGIGGPIIKDKLFFFFTYDQYRINFPGIALESSPSVFFQTPTAAELTTLQTRLGLASPAAAQTLYNNDLNSLISITGQVPRKGDQTIVLPKVDWVINEKNRFSVEVNRMRWNSPAGIQTGTGVFNGTNSFGNDYVKDTWMVSKLDTAFTPTLLNEARFQYGRDFEFEFSQPPSAYETSALLNNATFGYTNPLGFPPSVSISNGFTFGTPTFLERPAYPDERDTQFADTVTKTWGKHTFKFGGDIRHIDDLQKNLFEQFGAFSYTNGSVGNQGALINYFSDLNKADTCSAIVSGKTVATPCYASFAQGFGPLGYEFSTNDWGFFGQDDWKVSPRLTVNLGLRWDYEQMPSTFSNLVNPLIPQSAHLPSDKNNFGPRIGFAYDLFGDGKTVVRAGYGIYFGRIINGAIFNALTQTGIIGQSQLTFSFLPAQAGAPNFPQVFPSAPANLTTKANVAYFDPNTQNPQIHETDLTIEHDLGYSTVVSMSYLGSYGRELPNSIDQNLAPATSTITYTVVGGGPITTPTITEPLYTTRPNANFGQMVDILSNVNSSYNALALQLNHRMSQHVQFNANYTWAHAIDYGQNENTTGVSPSPVDPFNIRLDKGNSQYDVPNRFVFNMVLDSPWHKDGWLGYLVNGFELAPIYQTQNGLPYSLGTSGTAPGAVSGGGGINGSNGGFRIPQIGRATYRLPGIEVVDMRLSKHFNFKERYDLEFLGEGFNLMNHTNATSVNTTGYSIGGTVAAPTLTYQSNFGIVNNANNIIAFTPRQIQLGIRLHF